MAESGGGRFGRREWGGERLTVVGVGGSEGVGEEEEASELCDRGEMVSSEGGLVNRIPEAGT